MDTEISPLTLQRRRRLSIALAVAVLAAVGASAWGINRVLRPSLSATDIRIVEVRRGDIANAINASGVVIPLHEEQVSSPVQSRVAKVHARIGQKVAAGELLLQLDDQAPRLALDSLKEQLAQQENRIAALSGELDQKRKQILAAIELLELDLQSARVKRERYTTLRKAGGVSGEDMLTAELNVTRAEILLRQQRELIEDSKRATNTNIEGARLQKSILTKQAVQQQELLARTQVRAPFGGIVTMLVAEEGASVGMGQLVARVSEAANYQVEASLSDFHASMLSAGQQVTVEQGQATLHGKLHTVLPEIQNGTMKILVTLDQPNHRLLRNKMRVEVNVITERKTNALVATTGPAFNGKGRQPVYVIRDGVARKTMLDIGGGDGKAVEIVAGAQLGERLIASDTNHFKQHDSIRVTQ